MGSTSKASSHTDEDALLEAAVRDALRLCETRYVPRFVGFLDERQRVKVERLLQREGWPDFAFYGGHPDAERTFVGIFPNDPDAQAFPIEAMAFRYRSGVSLSHRDFLGTLLSCGIRREKVGDILCGDGLSVVFIERAIARYVEGQIAKVGGEGVTLIPDYDGELPASHSFKEIRGTVASPRLDAVVRTAVGISREEAAERIEAGLVSVNHLPCLSVSSTVRENDVLSVRGVGRFLVQSLGQVTKKGRLVLVINQYL